MKLNTFYHPQPHPHMATVPNDHVIQKRRDYIMISDNNSKQRLDELMTMFKLFKRCSYKNTQDSCKILVE